MSIIGFGKYHYKYEKTKHEGDSMIVGFSPRKSAISLYVYSDTQKQKELLEKLGKFKNGKILYLRQKTFRHPFGSFGSNHPWYREIYPSEIRVNTIFILELSAFFIREVPVKLQIVGNEFFRLLPVFTIYAEWLG